MFTAFWTWLLSKLSVKVILVGLVLAALLGAGWYGYSKLYDSIYAKGVASQAQTIKTLQDQLKDAQAATLTAEAKTTAVQKQLDAYVKQYNDYVATSQATLAKLQQDQAAAVAVLNKKITDLNKALTNAKTEFTNALPSLLPPGSSDDATCDLPLGIVQIYNASLTGTDPSGGFSVAFSVAPNAQLASGVSCGTFAGYVLNNNLAAYVNRQTVLDWVSWYTTNKTLVEQAIAAGKATPTPQTPSPISNP